MSDLEEETSDDDDDETKTEAKAPKIKKNPNKLFPNYDSKTQEIEIKTIKCSKIRSLSDNEIRSLSDNDAQCQTNNGGKYTIVSAKEETE